MTKFLHAIFVLCMCTFFAGVAGGGMYLLSRLFPALGIDWVTGTGFAAIAFLWSLAGLLRAGETEAEIWRRVGK